MVWLMTETENDTVTTSLLLYDFDLSEVSMVFQNNQPAETWLSPRLNDYNQIVYTRKAFLTTGEGTQDSFAVMLANPYYEGYSAYELSNGQRYLAYSRLSPVWSYIYAVPEANPEEYTMWAVVPLDRQISTDLYFFYYTDFSGNAYQGFIYNDYIYDYGYFAGAAVNDPLLAFQGYYSQVAEGTYDYIFQSPSGEVFTGQGLLTSMLGQFYGVSIDQGGYFVSLSQMLQTPVGHLSLANFWGNVLGACLLEYEEGETP
jgi:hypothetical protein